MPSTFSLIIPVFNEEKTLDFVLDKALAFGRIQECVVVNDGSVDGTDQVLKKRLERGEKKLRVITHPNNRGKGAAVRSAISILTTDFAVIQDADKEYDMENLHPLLEGLEQKRADVVYGSRFLRENPNIYKTYLWGNKFITAVINFLGNGSFTDAYTAYKGMSVERWRALELNSDGFEIEAEISLKILLAKWKIMEIPVNYAPRTFHEGKKIRGSDAAKGVWKALKIRLFASPPVLSN